MNETSFAICSTRRVTDDLALCRASKATWQPRCRLQDEEWHSSEARKRLRRVEICSHRDGTHVPPYQHGRRGERGPRLRRAKAGAARKEKKKKREKFKRRHEESANPTGQYVAIASIPLVLVIRLVL